jgi:RimJ/RimL family protein N-acetyltransferase
MASTLDPTLPWISDGKIALRRPELKDLNSYLGLRNNLELVASLMGYRKGVGEAAVRNWLERVGSSNEELVYTVIDLHDEERPVGYVKAFRFDPYARTAWIGLSLFSLQDQSQGYGRRMLRLLCEYLRDYLAVRKISLEVLDSNDRAIRLYEKMGFVEEGCLRAHAFIHGKMMDIRIYSLFLEEWSAS